MNDKWTVDPSSVGLGLLMGALAIALYFTVMRTPDPAPVLRPTEATPMVRGLDDRAPTRHEFNSLYTQVKELRDDVGRKDREQTHQRNLVVIQLRSEMQRPRVQQTILPTPTTPIGGTIFGLLGGNR